MDDENSNPLRRMSSRTRKVASKMAAALASSDNRTQAALARLEALENDNAGFDLADANDDDGEASLDDEDQVYVQKKQSKSTKRKTRQAKALEARKAPRTFLELLHEANLKSLPPQVPSYLKAAELDFQGQPLVATFVRFVVFLPITHVSDVVSASVHVAVKMYTMMPAA